MSDTNIVIVDDNYDKDESYSSAYSSFESAINSIISDYIKIIDDLIKDKGIEGDSADALGEFVKLLQNYVVDSLEDTYTNKRNLMDSFLREIDREDKNIY